MIQLEGDLLRARVLGVTGVVALALVLLSIAYSVKIDEPEVQRDVIEVGVGIVVALTAVLGLLFRVRSTAYYRLLCGLVLLALLAFFFPVGYLGHGFAMMAAIARTSIAMFIPRDADRIIDDDDRLG